MDDILVKIDDKRGYFSITYFKAKNKEEYEDNKQVLGYYAIQKDAIENARDFIRQIKCYYIENLSGKELVFIRDKW